MFFAVSKLRNSKFTGQALMVQNFSDLLDIVFNKVIIVGGFCPCPPPPVLFHHFNSYCSGTEPDELWFGGFFWVSLCKRSVVSFSGLFLPSCLLLSDLQS